MTGWRIGYAVGDEKIIAAMADLASHSTSNPTATSQYAAIEAYEGPQDTVETMRQAFEERLDIIFEKLITIPGVVCKKPQGAFYLYPNVKQAATLAGYKDVDGLVDGLLEEALVAVIPGSSFGSPDNIRLSYATSLDQLEEAVSRMKSFVESKITGQ